MDVYAPKHFKTHIHDSNTILPNLNPAWTEKSLKTPGWTPLGHLPSDTLLGGGEYCLSLSLTALAEVALVVCPLNSMCNPKWLEVTPNCSWGSIAPGYTISNRQVLSPARCFLAILPPPNFLRWQCKTHTFQS
jgi:hypothetical protein